MLCGLVLFNTIFLLMYLVGKIIGRSIYAECKNDHCIDCGEGEKPKCGAVKRLLKRLPYIFWFNILTLFFMAIDYVVYTIVRLCFNY